MKTKEELLKTIRHNQANIDKVSEFLEKNFHGNPVKYKGELTVSDIAYLNEKGYSVKLEDNGADKWGYESWFLIS
jgi:hypothetical protein